MSCTGGVQGAAFSSFVDPHRRWSRRGTAVTTACSVNLRWLPRASPALDSKNSLFCVLEWRRGAPHVPPQTRPISGPRKVAQELYKSEERLRFQPSNTPENVCAQTYDTKPGFLLLSASDSFSRVVMGPAFGVAYYKRPNHGQRRKVTVVEEETPGPADTSYEVPRQMRSASMSRLGRRPLYDNKGNDLVYETAKAAKQSQPRSCSLQKRSARVDLFLTEVKTKEKVPSPGRYSQAGKQTAREITFLPVREAEMSPGRREAAVRERFSKSLATQVAAFKEHAARLKHPERGFERVPLCSRPQKLVSVQKQRNFLWPAHGSKAASRFFLTQESSQ